MKAMKVPRGTARAKIRAEWVEGWILRPEQYEHIRLAQWIREHKVGKLSHRVTA